MTKLYFEADKSFIDYQPFQIPPLPGVWRGPAPDFPLVPGQYAVAIGAAQTFGRFVEKPYPALVAERIGMPVLNISSGGLGPDSFGNRQLMNVLNGARFCIVQAMSGRSGANDFFDGRTGANAFGLVKGSAGPAAFAETVLRHVHGTGDTALMGRVMHAQRRAWSAGYYWLARGIKVPKVLLWFAERDMDYHENPATFEGWIGSFPHAVDRATWLSVLPYYEHHVEVISRRGRPHRIMRDGAPVPLDMGNGTKSLVNRYYPSPAMHEDAALALTEICEKLAAGDPAPRSTVLSREPLARPPIIEADVKPNFLIIGAAKCGTSAIAVQLMQHPDIFIPDAKELHLFDRMSKSETDFSSREWQSYIAHFAGAGGFRHRGEATVSYTMLPHVKDIAEKIHNHLGKIPLIYVVRDPLQRIISYYRHAKRDVPATPALEEWIGQPAERTRAIFRSNYLRQIEPFVARFGSDRIKIVFHEEFEANHADSLADICRFLGADPGKMMMVRNVRVNRTDEKAVPRPDVTPAVLALLRKELLADTHSFLRANGRPETYWPSMA